jgi:hypothetical protein
MNAEPSSCGRVGTSAAGRQRAHVVVLNDEVEVQQHGALREHQLGPRGASGPRQPACDARSSAPHVRARGPPFVLRHRSLVLGHTVHQQLQHQLARALRLALSGRCVALYAARCAPWRKAGAAGTRTRAAAGSRGPASAFMRRVAALRPAGQARSQLPRVPEDFVDALAQLLRGEAHVLHGLQGRQHVDLVPARLADLRAHHRSVPRRAKLHCGCRAAAPVQPRCSGTGRRSRSPSLRARAVRHGHRAHARTHARTTRSASAPSAAMSTASRRARPWMSRGSSSSAVAPGWPARGRELRARAPGGGAGRGAAPSRWAEPPRSGGPAWRALPRAARPPARAALCDELLCRFKRAVRATPGPQARPRSCSQRARGDARRA